MHARRPARPADLRIAPPPRRGRGGPSRKPPWRRPPSRLARVLDLAVLVVVCILVLLPWSWDWFVPLIESRATALLNRQTTIAHLHVRPGRVVIVTLEGLSIAQPWGFEDEGRPFATARQVVIWFDLWAYLHRHRASFPLVAVDTPRISVVRHADGADNITASAPSPTPGRPALPDIRDLRVTNGRMDVTDARRDVELMLALHTIPPEDGNPEGGRIVADLHGAYDGRPVEGHLVSGAPLALARSDRPYPVALMVHGGRTLAALEGAVVNPLALAGAPVSIHLSGHISGPDLSLLSPLTGLPIPATPAYSAAGAVAYDGATLRLDDLRAKLGSSDLDGALRLDLHARAPALDADLHSGRVDLEDLAGLLAAIDPADMLRDLSFAAPFPIARLRAIDARLRYRAAQVTRRTTRLDRLEADIALQDGALDLRRLAAALNDGTLSGAMALTPSGDAGVTATLRIDTARLDLAQVAQAVAEATGITLPAARGIVGGHARLDATGLSAAGLLAHGTGRMALALERGGDLFTLLPALLGPSISYPILSALAFPKPTDTHCLIADLPLRDGLLSVATLLETDAGRTLGQGAADLRRDTLDDTLATQPAHPSPKPPDAAQTVSSPDTARIAGPLANPAILPGAETAPATTTGPNLAALAPTLLPALPPGSSGASACARILRAALPPPPAAAPPKPRPPAPASHAAPRKPAPARPVRHATARPRRPRPSPSPSPSPSPEPSDPHRLDAPEIRAIWMARQQQTPQPSNRP
ncbi:AsmA family protein [Gluconacetobacter johannae DSM 13595]|uniref:AsmA family protein n=1 Tax=Gluconacetobacter johannae TaxID=112140 RepID=A0A7W4J9Q0_9PROT|nr:AsmA family protein [Gluconacetobacter johannae]MBB2177262.1 AsmA family protein [Gluconacetobacter johannae]GBQ83363.1 AsmA family protein [Gluconacetobacter johannae DSM 13595]